MRRAAQLILTCLLLAPALVGADSKAKAPDWDPIPPEVWAMKESSIPDGRGAVILAKVVRLTNTAVEYQYRIRICSQRGKEAAEFGAFPSSTRELRGRVAFADGREVPFDSEKDFHAKKFVATRSAEISGTLVVPPGITEDCLVDIRWVELRSWRLAAIRGAGGESWDLASAYPISALTVEVAAPAYFAWNVNPGPTLPVANSVRPGFQVFAFHNVPAVLDMPYALSSSRDIPRLKAWVQDAAFQRRAWSGKDAYWGELTARYKDIFTKDLVMLGGYKEFSAELRKGLPATPQAAAQELASRLQARIRNRSFETKEEDDERARENASEWSSPQLPGDLERMVRRKAAYPIGIIVAYVNLLKECGIKPMVVLVANRRYGAFNPEVLNYNQLDDYLVAVDEPGKARLWLDPCLQYVPAGLIMPSYHDTLGLELDATAWTWRTTRIESQPAETNGREDTYRLELLPDQDRFTLETTFRGIDDYSERVRYVSLDPMEQDRLLLNDLEGRFPVSVEKAQVLNAKDPAKPLQWKLEGRADRAPGRHRRVDPFPITPLALTVPEDLPDTRKENIVLPWLSNHKTVSRFKVPAGYAFTGMEPLRKSNPFGTVTLTAERVEGPDGPDGPEVVATLDIHVGLARAAGGNLKMLKAFLGWIREAGTRELILEKVR